MRNHEKTKQDIFWEHMFAKENILKDIEKNGQYIISASTIKKNGAEPRLMVKFDHSINLPQIFLKNELAILPVSRGDYVIAQIKAYQPFEKSETIITRMNMKDFIQSLNVNNITSETMALNCALVAGIMEDFLEDMSLYPTVSGRMGTGRFEFQIDSRGHSQKKTILVNNSQIEIDAALEGVRYLSLIEAKLSVAEDFLVRQLYYPYRVWKERMLKKVKLVFLIYSNSIFNIYEYAFENPQAYNSLRLVKYKRYSIDDTEIEINEIQNVLRQVDVQAEPKISFPQADSFERVINLCELLLERDLDHATITENYAFDYRQTDYYANAGRYLGLIDKKFDANRKVIYFLTEAGQKILRLNYKKRQLAFCKIVLRHKVFRDVLKLWLRSGIMPDTKKVVEIMKYSNLYQVSGNSTYIRRASTVKGWLNWIMGLISK